MVIFLYLCGVKISDKKQQKLITLKIRKNEKVRKKRKRENQHQPLFGS